jgi:hypothetical protein
LAELQTAQSGWMLEMSFDPPLLTGITWSRVSFIRGSRRPHFAQAYPAALQPLEISIVHNGNLALCQLDLAAHPDHSARARNTLQHFFTLFL